MSYTFLEQPGKPGEERLSVEGELDLAASPKLEEWGARVLATGARHLILDLTNTTFIDSTAVRGILRVHDLAQAAGASYVVVAENTSVLRVFQITGLDKKLAINRPGPHPVIAKGLRKL